MRAKRPERRWRIRGGVAAVLACLAGLVPVVAAEPERSTYIIQLRAEPLASYAGDGSLAATSPKVTGRKLDPASAAVADYHGYLGATEADVLRAAGVPETAVGYRYRTTLAGFSAELSASEAERIRQQPMVAAVTADRIRSARRQPTPTADNFEGEGGAADPAAVTPQQAVPRQVASQQVASHPVAATTAPAADLSGQPADFLGLADGLWARLGGPEHAGWPSTKSRRCSRSSRGIEPQRGSTDRRDPGGTLRRIAFRRGLTGGGRGRPARRRTRGATGLGAAQA